MDPTLFRTTTAGRCLRQPEGYWAFVPNPLPPRLEIDWPLANLLAEANACVGELAGAGRRLVNPRLLIQPYIRREAVLSSRIEGTEAGLEDLFVFEAAGAETPGAPDAREVANYVRAMEHGLDRLTKLPFSGRLVREVHELLMRDTRGGYATPGHFRRTQNWIGAPGCTLMAATYVPPPVAAMNEALSDWEKYLHSSPREPVLIQCALMHYQFEAIHPFIDGNGRIGRLLITFLLSERRLLTQPLLYLSAFFERHRDEYYRRLLGVSTEGDWRGWIEFFLRGVATQARDAADKAGGILDLHEELQARVRSEGRAPRHTPRMVERLFTNPVISMPRMARDLDLPYSSVKRCVEYLRRLGILVEFTGQRRNRLFVAARLIQLLVGDDGAAERASSPALPRRRS